MHCDSRNSSNKPASRLSLSQFPIHYSVMNRGRSFESSMAVSEESAFDLRRGPWTLEEDNLLIHYIACHGEGRWNTLAKSSGLKRTGKSCRLRWLNYLKPDIKRGNLTPQEQLLILELHSKWGNRWSKIAQHLPGRTDNEIKNYWRTRVQKQARQLNVDSNSRKFLEAIRSYWMPRLIEKMNQNSSLSSSSSSLSSHSSMDNHDFTGPSLLTSHSQSQTPLLSTPKAIKWGNTGNCHEREKSIPFFINSITDKGSSDSLRKMQMTAEVVENPASPVQTLGYNSAYSNVNTLQEECYHVDLTSYDLSGFSHQPEMSALESHDIPLLECQIAGADLFNDEMSSGSLWNMDDLWHFRKSEVGI